MIGADRVADVLGGRSVLRRSVRSIGDLRALVEAGLPKASLAACARAIADNPRAAREIIYGTVPEATFKRRRQRLKRDESERTERLARVMATAEAVWRNSEDARRFMTAAHPLLDGRRPIDVARSELGARQIEEILWQAYHGLPL